MRVSWQGIMRKHRHLSNNCVFLFIGRIKGLFGLTYFAGLLPCLLKTSSFQCLDKVLTALLASQEAVGLVTFQEDLVLQAHWILDMGIRELQGINSAGIRRYVKAALLNKAVDIYGPRSLHIYLFEILVCLQIMMLCGSDAISN